MHLENLECPLRLLQGIALRTRNLSQAAREHLLALVRVRHLLQTALSS